MKVFAGSIHENREKLSLIIVERGITTIRIAIRIALNGILIEVGDITIDMKDIRVMPAGAGLNRRMSKDIITITVVTSHRSTVHPIDQDRIICRITPNAVLKTCIAIERDIEEIDFFCNKMKFLQNEIRLCFFSLKIIANGVGD